MTARRTRTSAPARTSARARKPASGRKTAPARKPASKRTPTPARKPASKRTPTPARKPASKRTPVASRRSATGRRRPPSRLRRLVAGDRVYAFVFLGVVAALVTIAIGPLQSYTAAADRVDGLTETRDILREEVDRLEERRERLHDPEEIELMARSNLGLVKPGEVPFVVVTPESQLDRVHPDGAGDTPPEPGPWYRRLGRWLGDLLP